MNRFRYLNTSLSCPLSSLYKADEIKLLNLLVVARVSDSVAFLFYQCLALNEETRIALHVRDVGGLGICIMG